MRVAREEIFGPVLSVIPFEDEEELIRQANDTRYGLAPGSACPHEQVQGRGLPGILRLAPTSTDAEVVCSPKSDRQDSASHSLRMLC